MTPTDPNRFYVTFWGTRGSISTPGSGTEKYGGNTSCVSVRYGDVDIILDAGTGIRNLGLRIAREYEDMSHWPDIHVLLSHTHWDHIQGLPFFQPAYEEGVSLNIYGSQKKGRFLESILRGQMDVDYFPVGMSALAADVAITELHERHVTIGPIDIEWEEQVFHPGGSVRYRITTGGRRIVYSTDVELDGMFCGADSEETARLSAEYLDFVREADLLIADGQYTAGEYTHYVGRGHTSIPMLLNVAHQAKVKQLAVFHHDPEHTDAVLDKLWADYRPSYADAEPPMSLFWSREGLTIAV